MKSLKQKQRLMIILNDQSQEKTSIKQSNITTRISTNIGTNKQNFQGEVLSGYVMSLIKQTQENIRLAMREKNMGRNLNNTTQGYYPFKAVSTGLSSRIQNKQERESYEKKETCQK